MSTLIALSGPTASGKSGWGIALAKDLKGAIICADSRTVYTELNIGAGKVTTEYPAAWRDSPHGPIATVEGIDHYGLNLVDLTETFTVGQFQQRVLRILPVLWRQGLQPIIVGGTGLYLSAVLEGYTFTGRGGRNRHEPPWSSRVCVIDRARETLYRQIDERVDTRLAHGLLTEVKDLVAQGQTDRLLRLGLEYRVLTEYCLGEQSPEQLAKFVTRLKGEIHAYARRQLTWWRHRPDVHWVSSYTELRTTARDFLGREEE